MIEEEELAAGFETQRSYLHAIAFRVLGSHADADDAVQEAWLRLARTGGGGIEDLRGWLTMVTGRICLDVLRRRGARAEQPLEISIGMLAREAAGDRTTGPEEEALLADSVSLALYVVMDALTPAERVSFVLHDVFEVPFGAIATILGRSTAATKMRTRRRGRSSTRSPEGAGWCSRPGRVYDLQTAMASRRGISMTLYMYQASYTAKSMAAQLTEPHDPMEAIAPTLEDLGATIVVAGFPFGEYDVLIVYEAADDVTAASVAMAVAAAGEVKSAKTTRLLSGQEWLESLRKRRIVTRNLRQPHDRPGQRPEPS